ncbi:NAD(P)/FAD-dependent oxidoreductase [Streptomyces sp. SGAir0957]
MRRHADVLVVGAGLFGSAAAKYLARSGVRTLVIGPAEPASTAGASLAQFGAWQDESRIARCLGWDRFWGAVDTRSTARYRGIEAESGVGFFRECGALALIARSLGKRTEAMLTAGDQAGVMAERMPAAALRRAFPALHMPPVDGGVEGLWEPTSAYLNPRQLVHAQLRLATASGAELLRGTVRSMHRDRPTGPWRAEVDGTEAGGTVTVQAPRVLLAAGALVKHSNALPAPSALDLQIFTEPNLLFEVAGEQLARHADLPTVVTIDPADTGNDNMSAYLMPPIRYPDGKWYLRIGPAMQPLVHELRTPDAMCAWYAEQRITTEQSQFLARMMRLLLPGLEPVSVREACCVVDKTRTRYPYIGPWQDTTLTVAVGGNGHGARGSDEIGRLASTVVLNQPWDFPLPQAVLSPANATTPTCSPEYLQPPFGLC